MAAGVARLLAERGWSVTLLDKAALLALSAPLLDALAGVLDAQGRAIEHRGRATGEVGGTAGVERELEGVKKTRKLHRDSRKRVPYPIVALVGYTNAGKSTLFNGLTGADAYADDRLFATLDPTVRRVTLAGGYAVLADTVGFVRDLPHELVAAFRSTPAYPEAIYYHARYRLERFG